MRTMPSTVTPRISVITVCLNSAATIERTLASVRAQTWPNVEHIVIDGGSTDGTLEIIRRYESSIANWTSEPDRGLYDAMNKGIARATGDWVHILNSDDVYVDEMALARIVPHLDQGSTNYYRMLLSDPEKKEQIYDFPYRAWKLYVSAYLPHPAMVVSRRQYHEVGLYDLRYRVAADHHFTMRMVQRFPGRFVPEPFVVMAQGGFSARNAKIALEETREIAVAFGLPRWMATCLYYLKRAHWRV